MARKKPNPKTKKANLPNHGARKHNVLSPSSSHRWLECLGSLENIEDYPSPMSEPAAFGTAAHELADMVLSSHVQSDKAKPAKDYIGETIVVTCDDTGKTFQYEVDKEMAENVQRFVDVILSLASLDPDAIILCEDRLNADFIVEGLEGTVDAAVILPNLGELITADLKYGAGVVVEVEENSQLIIYMGGLIAKARELFPKVKWKKFHTYIYQPRAHHPDGTVRRWEYSPEDLKKWFTKIRYQGEAYYEALEYGFEGEYVAGDHCLWCPKATECEARDKHVMQVIQSEFGSEFDPVAPEDLNAEQIAFVLENAKQVRQWLTDVEVHARKAIIDDGMKLPNFKVVAGRGSRSWVNPDTVEKVLLDNLKALGVKKEQLYTPATLRSPAQIEEVLKKESKASPAKIEAFCKKFIRNQEGLPTIAPVSDKRKEIESSASNDFTKVERKTKKKR